MTFRWSFLLVIAALAPIPMPAHALPILSKTSCIVIASFPYTITAPGNYCLDADHVTDSGGGIQIASDNVNLDCKGHSITKSIRGPAYSAGVYTDSNRSSVTVQNCRIKDFGRGIVVGGRNVRILNNWVDGAMREGVAAGGHSAQVLGNRITNTYNDDSGDPHTRASIAIYPYDFDVVTGGQVVGNNTVVGAEDGFSVTGIGVYGASAPMIHGNVVLDLMAAGSTGVSAIALGEWGTTPTTGAVLTRNSIMARWPDVRALYGSAAQCTNNVAIGVLPAAFTNCQAGAGNTVVP